MITIITLGVIVALAGVIYWPPFLMYISEYDAEWYRKVSNKAILVPRLAFAAIVHLAALTLLFVAAIFHAIELDGVVVPDDLDVVAFVLFFANITSIHILQQTILTYHSTGCAIIISAVSAMSAVALTAICGVLGYWISMGLVIGYCFYMFYLFAGVVNIRLSRVPYEFRVMTTTTQPGGLFPTASSSVVMYR
jgi:hypothetical protein